MVFNLPSTISARITTLYSKWHQQPLKIYKSHKVREIADKIPSTFSCYFVHHLYSNINDGILSSPKMIPALGIFDDTSIRNQLMNTIH